MLTLKQFFEAMHLYAPTYIFEKTKKVADIYNIRNGPIDTEEDRI